MSFCCQKSRLTERPDSIDLPEENDLLKGSDLLASSDFEFPAPLVLTPSEASDCGLCPNSDTFQFPSPPKKFDALSSPARSSFRSSPTKSPVAAASESSIQDELRLKLSRRLTKIEKIESGEEKAFDKSQINSDEPGPSQGLERNHIDIVNVEADNDITITPSESPIVLDLEENPNDSVFCNDSDNTVIEVANGSTESISSNNSALSKDQSPASKRFMLIHFSSL